MPSDAFRLVPVGLLPTPGTCCKCGSNLRPAIDFGITVEYFGAVLICVECIMDIVNVEELDLMHRSEASILMAENERLIRREDEMQLVRRDLRNALVAVADSIDSRVSHPSVSSMVIDEVTTPERFNFLEAFGETD